MFFRLFRRLGLITHYGVGLHLGRQGYPREHQGIEVPLYGWVEDEPSQADSDAATPDDTTRAAPLHSVN